MRVERTKMDREEGGGKRDNKQQIRRSRKKRERGTEISNQRWI